MRYKATVSGQLSKAVAMSDTLKPDREQARSFLSMFGDVKCDDFTFQAFKDTLPKDPKKAKHTTGTFTGCAQFLIHKQREGCGAFVTVNQCNGMGRKAENVMKIRALFIDCDGAPWEPPAEALKPHIRVESSPGRWHLYWLVLDCSIEEFKPMQKAIASKYGGDPAVCDPPRVMRLPGFWHLKAEPFMTRLVECNDDLLPYALADIVAGLGIEERESSYAQRELEDSISIARFEFANPETGEAIDLAKWAALHRDFDIIKTLRESAPHVIRGEVKDGRQHIQCPYQHEHTDQASDTATFVANRQKGKGKTDGFVIHCLHGHCAGRDRLQFLLEMFRQGWLPASILLGTVEAKRPPKVYLPTLDMMKDAAWDLLSSDERRIALHLAFVAMAFENGTVPDDIWLLSRQLGLTEQDWQHYRQNLLRAGWLIIEAGRLLNPIIRREFDSAWYAYNARIQGGYSRHKGLT